MPGGKFSLSVVVPVEVEDETSLEHPTVDCSIMSSWGISAATDEA